MSPWTEMAAKLLGIAGYALLEYYIGKTDKIKANSLIELLINLLQKLKRPS